MGPNLNLKNILQTAFRTAPKSDVLLLILMCLVCYLTPDANNADIQYLQSLILNSGAMFTAVCATVYFLAVNRFSFTLVFSLIVKTVCILIFGYSLLGLFGDQVLSFFAQKPNLQVLYIFVVFVFVFAISRLFNSILNAPGSVISSLAPTQSTVPNLNKFTLYDLERVAAHEAGHLMLSFSIGKLPHDFRAQIFINGSDIGAAGMVTSINSPDYLPDPVFDSWRMYVLLAGQLAENYIHNLKTNGSASDYEKWQMLARQHLENQHEGNFYINPANDLEFQHNNLKIAALRASQSETIIKFFELNHASLIKMYEALKEKKNLQRDEIIELFRGMQHLEELPYPNGKFEVIS